MPDSTSTTPKSSWLSTLGWAAYLACSWTWCIGMFLPVLLVRDYGIWGFVVFAVPNVVGAGAMGWVLQNAQSAQRVRERHIHACQWFSAVTIAFQFYFLQALNGLDVNWWSICAFTLCGFLGGGRSIAGVVWIVSVGLLLLSWNTGAMHLPPTVDSDDAAEVLWLAPVCLFGFALCPYLDLTFLRTRAMTSNRESRASFGLGFGLLFLTMILGTLFYTGTALGVLSNQTAILWAAGTIPLVVHISIQLAYTIRAHELEIERSNQNNENSGGVHTAVVVFGGLLAGGVMHGVGFVLREWLKITPLSAFETGYRLFMSFYGLIFPAYVWLCMIPVRSEMQTQRPTRQKLMVLGFACLLAAPCYWMGFIARETVWLVPGLGVVLVARLFVRPASPATGGGGARGLARAEGV